MKLTGARIDNGGTPAASCRTLFSALFLTHRIMLCRGEKFSHQIELNAKYFSTFTHSEKNKAADTPAYYLFLDL